MEDPEQQADGPWIGYDERRAKMVMADQSMSFSYCLEGTLTVEELKVDDILKKLVVREGLKTDMYNIAIHDFHLGKVSL